ncbi:MAG: DUF4136 domain-containing protein [Akkermansiaceae bacterium]|nr:DUF4136 domain-containing protein [Akkermansiaceae bacterium]
MNFRLLLPLAAGLALASCSSSIEMPKGTSKGYQTARLVRRAPNAPGPANAEEGKIHGMIQKAIAARFHANGIAYGAGGTDLVVSYLVVYQETGMTTYYDEYFGYAGSGEEIADQAHERGVIKGKRKDYYESAGLVIDVTDARTNELIFRNYYKSDIARGTSDAVRSQRINAAVAQTLAPFFR